MTELKNMNFFDTKICKAYRQPEKKVSTKLWYSTIGHLAARWLSTFSAVARACAHASIIFTAVSKREAVR